MYPEILKDLDRIKLMVEAALQSAMDVATSGSDGCSLRPEHKNRICAQALAALVWSDIHSVAFDDVHWEEPMWAVPLYQKVLREAMPNPTVDIQYTLYSLKHPMQTQFVWN